jgi:hypothetical protein
MSFKRGSFNKGRGRGRGSGAGPFTRGLASTSAQPSPPRPFGPAIESIDIKALLLEEYAPKIEDVKYVASYNWLATKSPEILVPGQPVPEPAASGATRKSALGD